MNSWGLRPGPGEFLKLKCPVNSCVLSGNRADLSSADMVLFKDHFSMPPGGHRDPQQVGTESLSYICLSFENFHANRVNT